MTDLLRSQYTIQEELGRGRFGIVHRCTCKSTGHPYALKTIDKTLTTDDPLDSQCLTNEPKLHSLVSTHQNIVSYHKSFQDTKHLHILTELFTPHDLLHYMTSSNKRIFPEHEAALIMSQLMHALDHCHKHGVAHRDIKPDNILYNPMKRVLKVVDFGFAEMFGETRKMKGVVDTPCYVAPEVVLGRDYGEKVDVWSAGVVLYGMLSGGVLPFYGEDLEEIFDKVCRGNLRFPVKVFRHVSLEAKELLRKMLCKDVSSRLSAHQVLRYSWITSNGVSRVELT